MQAGVTVVKVGGNEVDDALWVRELSFALGSCHPVVMVHGGGREVSALQASFGAEPEWRDGLRVSSPETVRIAAMVLTGIVNKRLVAALLAAGTDALGISGEDGALVTARPVRGGALGRTGEPVAVRTELLRSLLSLGLVPVVSPISRGDDGAPLNVNADDVAGAIAAAVSADRLLFVTNVSGVTIGGDVAEELVEDDLERAIEAGTIGGGMAPKARAAARASAAGVADVRIGGLDLLSGGAGTRVLARAQVLA
jgi:acetylglutamate kinase